MCSIYNGYLCKYDCMVGNGFVVIRCLHFCPNSSVFVFVIIIIIIILYIPLACYCSLLLPSLVVDLSHKIRM